ncbi:sulfotransferase [Magnetospira sp. QH-2]|uniref:sulfotransferase family protein n=1 Tax=Magnetospira sp. (strain QH-2) TaxID=1288970 RepID=UPI0003E80B64|nr:sulfotransferase [Magnetospira sp. QH-2]CCQ73108.1 protein of unknown function [Magnetospira sp. QH-2]
MPLPTFIVIGSAKCGTTSIHAYMQQHPNVCMSRNKETNFFAYGDDVVKTHWSHLPHPVKTMEEYLDQFHPEEGETALGEASPIYFNAPSVPQRIMDTVPDVKLILSLRNPVDRAISGYFMHIREGAQANNFDDFDFRARYVAGSYYAELLQRYTSVFGLERIKIVLFEDLKRDAGAFMSDLYDYVGVDAGFSPDMSRTHNPGKVPKNEALNRFLLNPTLRNKIAPLFPAPLRKLGKSALEMNRTRLPKFPEDLRAQLVDHCRDDVEKLRDLTGLDFAAWKEFSA